MSTYYTDREYGARPPSIDTIDERLWAGLYTLIQIRISDGSFGLRFPELCPDGNGPCGCDEQAFRRVLAAEVPWIEWPLSATETPETPVILDLLEFCARAVGEPIQGVYHSVSGVLDYEAASEAVRVRSMPPFQWPIIGPSHVP